MSSSPYGLIVWIVDLSTLSIILLIEYNAAPAGTLFFSFKLVLLVVRVLNSWCDVAIRLVFPVPLRHLINQHVVHVCVSSLLTAVPVVVVWFNSVCCSALALNHSIVCLWVAGGHVGKLLWHGWCLLWVVIWPCKRWVVACIIDNRLIVILVI